MNLTDSRHISFYLNGETILVQAQSHPEYLRDKIKVRFTFAANNPAGIDEVIADNLNGYVRMVNSKGTEFTGGPLFDQLFVWYDYIIKR